MLCHDIKPPPYWITSYAFIIIIICRNTVYFVWLYQMLWLYYSILVKIFPLSHMHL